ncbi:alpha/beta hydrolase [Muriicola soli]|uniref:Esterase n=1 Tax=Muriicola soli TaxID=2507538 RepID=A0A411E9D0_9FLAO|nr:esterase [Muriicola soli]QBA64326.1 esterase [Muriicola soli]
MDLTQKDISFTNRKPYATLNKLHSKTKYVWFVFHGMGYLSKYFLRYFKDLNHEENYLIAPQAPSKYYMNGEFKHVGASWLTKEDTEMEIDNIMEYLDAVLQQEALPENVKLVIFGYSQGVSIAMRWVARKKIVCSHLILYAGGMPNELKVHDLSHLRESTQIRFFVGKHDEYITPARWDAEKRKIEHLFQGKAAIEIFVGGHEVKNEIIKKLP